MNRPPRPTSRGPRAVRAVRDTATGRWSLYTREPAPRLIRALPADVPSRQVARRMALAHERGASS